MTEFRKARREDAEEILDFINYVFSYTSRPHDFKTLNPQMYNSDYPFWDDHYVAVEDNKIAATLSVTKEKIIYPDIDLSYGHVGQVSVHPYKRSRGYMRTLMWTAIDDMKKQGYELSILGGQRQRYGYYGYTPGFFHYYHDISSTNIRHALAGRAPRVTLDADGNAFKVISNGECIGKIGHNSLVLDDYSFTADAIAAYFEATKKSDMALTAEFYEIDRASVLSEICENPVINSPYYRLLIFNFRRVLVAGIKLRAAAGLCDDGEVTIKVGDECFGLRVCGRVAEDFDCDDAMYTFEPAELQDAAVSLLTSTIDRRFPRGWFPISLR